MLARHCIIDGFLGATASQQLLEYALANEARFETSVVYGEEGALVDPSSRKSVTLAGDWSAASASFEAAILRERAAILEAVGMDDFEQAPLELQFVASRDGDFFECHSDTGTGSDRMDADRIVSAVYYLHREPKGFSDGELVLHSIGGGEPLAIEPLHDRLVAFPSFAPHEVTPTRVASGNFADARFSINCWLSRVRR